MTNRDKIFDALLVVQCQSGSKKAITLLVKRWHTRLCKQAHWYTRDSEIAKDIAQDSWSVILNKIHSLKDPNGFGSWALKIVSRKAIDWHRKHKKELKKLETHYDTIDANGTSHHNTNTDNLLFTIHGSIQELPYKQQMILNLFYLEEFSIRQVSEILNISTGTVKSRLFTAREKLKTILKNRNYEK